MVERNCHEPFQFFCQTDKTGFRSEVEVLPFLKDLPHSTPEEMWNTDDFLHELPRLWSACLNVSNKKPGEQRVQSLSVGIKRIGSQEESPSGVPEMVTAEGLLVWRDIYWLSMPKKAAWIVPEKHVFVLGDCPAASRDSRQWGSLPLDTIQGTVLQRGFP